MIEQVYNFSLDVTWPLIHQMSQLDRFDAQWTTIEKREGQSLKQLKSIATVRSVGASYALNLALLLLQIIGGQEYILLLHQTRAIESHCSIYLI